MSTTPAINAMSDPEYLYKNGPIAATAIHASQTTWDDFCDANTFVPAGFRYDLVPASVHAAQQQSLRWLTSWANQWGAST